MFNLGYCYCNCDSLKKDFSKAIYWYDKSVERKNPFSQLVLGISYFYGEGVEQNFNLKGKIQLPSE